MKQDSGDDYVDIKMTDPGLEIASLLSPVTAVAPAPHRILVILLLLRVTSTWLLGFVHAGPSARDTCCIEPGEILLIL